MPGLQLQRPRPGAPAASAPGRLEAAPGVRAVAQAAETDEARVTLLDLAAATGDAGLRRVRADSRVAYAYPVLVDPATGNRLLLTNRIIAGLRPGTAPEALAERHGLRVVRRLRGTRDHVLLALADPKHQDALVAWSRMKATTRISAPHDGHTRGSTS